jgi:predicted RNA-binding protein with PUA-like domain
VTRTEPAKWLFKEEPEVYNFSDLERDGTTLWQGINNPLARKNLRNVTIGDRALYYHTGKERAIVGEMQITEGPMPDPDSDDSKAVVVRVEAAGRWPVPLTLERIKKDKVLAAWDLVRLPRLSVVPISPAQWERLQELRET